MARRRDRCAFREDVRAADRVFTEMKNYRHLSIGDGAQESNDSVLAQGLDHDLIVRVPGTVRAKVADSQKSAIHP
jgi:hypothetical protein